MSAFPVEVMDVILDFALESSSDRGWSDDYQIHRLPGFVCPLRLVCRSWADSIYRNHMFREIQILQKQDCIELLEMFDQHFLLTDSSQQIPRCKTLVIDRSKVGSRASRCDDSVNSLSTLIELLSESINHLCLYTAELSGIQEGTVKAIQGIKALHTLQLLTSDPPQEAEPETLDTLDSDDLQTLFGHIARRVIRLDLLYFPLWCLPKLKSCHISPSSVQQLDVQLEDDDEFETLAHWCNCLKNSLRVLRIHSFPNLNHFDDLRPIFEPLKNTLEGLHIPVSFLLRPLSHYAFTKLKVLALGCAVGGDANVGSMFQGDQRFDKLETLMVEASLVDRRRFWRPGLDPLQV